MIRIKVCGITRAEDAMLAAELGAAAVGFVFWPRSPRAVNPEAARRIAALLPPFVTPVGVFVNEPVEAIQRIARQVRLGAVQLHGDESPAVLAALDRPVIRAVSLPGPDGEAFDAWRDATLLVDAHDPIRRGGTGRQADWARAAELAARRPVILSGGLGADNVRDAVQLVRPAAIDVSSGVEASPGVKDHARMRNFFAAVAAAAGTDA